MEEGEPFQEAELVPHVTHTREELANGIVGERGGSSAGFSKEALTLLSVILLCRSPLNLHFLQHTVN